MRHDVRGSAACVDRTLSLHSSRGASSQSRYHATQRAASSRGAKLSPAPALRLQALVPDYADDDYRKQFQDNWYGTSTKADLPEWLRSRPSTNVLTRTSSPPDAVAEPESLPTLPEGEGGEERT